MSVRLETATTPTTFTYTVNTEGTTCTITGFNGKESGDLTIPSSIDGYTVTAIGNSAFTYTNFDGKLTLPDTIAVIGNQAFAGCDKLTGQLVFPANLKIIKASAFMDCKGFTGELVFNDKLESIGRGAFYCCDGLTGSLLLPDSLVEMQKDSFYYCNNLDGVLHIPTGITNWSASYVTQCDHLTGFDVSDDHPSYCVKDGILYSKDMTKLIQCMITKAGKVSIPEGVTIIGEQAFYRCEKITAISLPSTLKKVERWAFGQTSGITEAFVLPNSLEYLEDSAFALSKGPRGTLVFRSKWQVGQSVFEGCNFTTIIVEEGVKTLPPYTFCGGSDIRKVVMPSTLQEIGNYCFAYINNLAVYGYSGTAAEQFVTSAAGSSINAKFFPLNNGFALSDAELTLLLTATNGAEHQLTVLTTGTELAATDVTWRSADEHIATVTNGLVKAHATGRTIITAAIGDIVLECILVVHEGAVINGVEFSADGRTLIKVSEDFNGELIIPEGVEEIAYEAISEVNGLTGITFPSSLKKLAHHALIRTGYSEGLTLIFPDSISVLEDIAVDNCCFVRMHYPANAKVGMYAFSMCNISVLVIPEGVSDLPQNVFQYAYIGNCYLPASLSSAPYNAFENATVGTFYGYSGTYAEQYVAELQAYYPDKTFTFVSLGAPINHSQYTLIAGETVQLTWLDNASWTSSDESVAIVDANGLVTGIQSGNATITATTDSGVSASCRITVKAAGYGDANSDGVVDVYDVLVILQHCAGWQVTLNAQNADVTEDGFIDLSDALQILMECMGNDLVSAVRALQVLADQFSIKLVEIVVQPVDQYIQLGEKAQFAVTATGDGLTYQWQVNRNDSKGWQSLDKATNILYVTCAVTLDHNGYQYRCIITDAFGNEVTSNVAVLHVELELPVTGDSALPQIWLATFVLSLLGIISLYLINERTRQAS